MNTDRFKFRVWDDLNKRYAYNYSLDADGVIWNGQTVCREATIEQCTGLRDKNGKLIYEGDVLNDPESDCMLNIEYQKGCFGYVWAKCFFQMPPWINQLIVVGNIHEEKWRIVK